MPNTIKNIFFYDRRKNHEFSEIEKFLIYLDKMLFTQEPFFQQKQLNLIKKSIKVFNDEIYNQQLTKEQALDIFKDSILQQIEIHEHSHFFKSLKVAINDYFTNM